MIWEVRGWNLWANSWSQFYQSTETVIITRADNLFFFIITGVSKARPWGPLSSRNFYTRSFCFGSHFPWWKHFLRNEPFKEKAESPHGWSSVNEIMEVHPALHWPFHDVTANILDSGVRLIYSVVEISCFTLLIHSVGSPAVTQVSAPSFFSADWSKPVLFTGLTVHLKVSHTEFPGNCL